MQTISKDDIYKLRDLAIECLYSAEEVVRHATHLWPVHRRGADRGPAFLVAMKAKDIQRRAKQIEKVMDHCDTDVIRWDHARLDDAMEMIRVANNRPPITIGEEIAATAHEAAVASARHMATALEEAYEHEFETAGTHAQFMVDRIRELPGLRRLEGLIRNEAAAAVRWLLNQSGNISAGESWIEISKSGIMKALQIENRRWSVWRESNRHALQPMGQALTVENARRLKVNIKGIEREHAVLILNFIDRQQLP